MKKLWIKACDWRPETKTLITMKSIERELDSVVPKSYPIVEELSLKTPVIIEGEWGECVWTKMCVGAEMIWGGWNKSGSFAALNFSRRALFRFFFIVLLIRRIHLKYHFQFLWYFKNNNFILKKYKFQCHYFLNNQLVSKLLSLL